MLKLKLHWAFDDTGTAENEVAIVVDILRASTVITTALHLGAEAIIPTSDVDEAFRWAKQHDALLVGERECLKIRGFDLGNSPVEMLQNAAKIKNRTIIFSSTNFPRACLSAQKSPAVFIGCILNIKAVTEHTYRFAQQNGYDLCFVLAGTDGNPTDEDVAFAGYACNILNQHNDIIPDQQTLDAAACVQKKGLKKAIASSQHAKRLIRLGFKKDVKFASQKDTFDTIPICESNKIFKLPKGETSP